MSCPSSEFFHERAKRFDGGGCQRRNVVGETATRGDHYGTGETCEANAYRARPNAPRTGCHPSARTASSSDRVARSCISVSRPENHDHRFQHTFLSAPFFFSNMCRSVSLCSVCPVEKPSPVSDIVFWKLGLFRVFSSAQNSRTLLVLRTDETYQNQIFCPPRSAAAKRARSPATSRARRCCTFSARPRATTSRASPVARHERPHRVEEDRGRTHDAVGVRRGRDGAGPAQHASR